MPKWALSLPLLAFVSACQTTSYIEPKLPIAVERLFSTCSQGEGNVFLSVRDQGQYLFGTEMDWVANGSQAWSLEAYNSFGQTVGRVHGDLQKPGLLLSLPAIDAGQVSVDENKSIYIQGHYIGIKLDEIPCLLTGRIPKSWQANITSYEETQKGAKLAFHHGNRNISLILNDLAKVRPSFCADYQWSEYMGFVNHQFEHCFLGKDPASSLIKYGQGVTIKWVEKTSI
ncbi:hypothetical protein [Pseudobacteriovorax antillogorgiicola]|uniref:Lipoprotein n=2 Tax=Pseudobacteriovorax antillogorgiicola TaxID=1513793 RepID=A0A1Y6B224_9BACT|nr:hypothetical protein [Pseudobacteriovorax antillogorgiicola]TCS59553.1 hypothetical protein EDD56_101473 [Pseudobacteriovorax antillogorgiicola]SME87739.1 hypothetical protein SAMN06296036_10112 [Pseudobacteriovorax antillogorgiicola]